jgi:methionyl-tRNA synthetase
MKTRTSLVSNSSTSSFICAVCNESEGYDDSCSLSDIGAFECDKCGRTIHNDCGNEEKCPICNLESIPLEVEVFYLRNLLGKTKEEIIKNIKTNFVSYDNFTTWMRGQMEGERYNEDKNIIGEQ